MIGVFKGSPNDARSHVVDDSAKSVEHVQQVAGPQVPELEAVVFLFGGIARSLEPIHRRLEVGVDPTAGLTAFQVRAHGKVAIRGR